MIKKCKVLTRNDVNMVIDFEGMQVQMPTMGNERFVYVDLDKGVFTIFSEKEFLSVPDISKNDSENITGLSKIEPVTIEPKVDPLGSISRLSNEEIIE